MPLSKTLAPKSELFTIEGDAKNETLNAASQRFAVTYELLSKRLAPNSEHITIESELSNDAVSPTSQ